MRQTGTNRILYLGCLLLWLGLPLAAFAQQTEPYLNEAPLYNQSGTDSARLNPPKSTADKVTTAPCNRTAVVNDYITNFLGSAVSLSELGWTGNVTGCISGSISALAQTRTIQRINYYRRLVGLTDNITFDASHNAETQDAALMMKANNSLSHSPPSTWTCFTNAGYSGASNSNIALGSFAATTVKQFIDDDGSNNTVAGHRRWILYSKAASFGHGSTDYSDVLWVFNPTVTPASVPAFVAFPTQGYMPRDLIPARWSFTIPTTLSDLSSATVTMQDEANAPISVTAYAVATGYGDNTLVWDLASPATALAWNGVTDKVFTVRVSGVKINSVVQPDYVYAVVAIDASLPVFTVTGTNPPCGSTQATGSATVSFDRGAKSILWNTGATTATITGLTSGTYTVTVTDGNNCTLTKSIVLSNAVSNTPSLSATATSICGGEATVLTAGNCTGTLAWSNGLGTGTTKSVTPAVTTTYSVTCTESTCPGSSASVTIGVAPGPVPACSITVTNGLSVYFGVENFTFNTINVASGSSSTDQANYMNRSCTAQTTVTAGTSYSMSVKGYYTNTHSIKVYIDYNNNGVLTDANELVLSGVGNLISGTVTIPPTASANTFLRIRVLADPSGSSNACSIVGDPNFHAGQIEDYALFVSAPCTTLYTLKAGNWDDVTVWSCNRVPVATDPVQLKHLVTIPAGYVAHAQKLSFDAATKLTYGNNARLLLNQ